MVAITNILQWVEIAKRILPSLLSVFGVPGAAIDAIVKAVTDAETAFGQGTGLQKLQAVLQIVEDVLTALGSSPAEVQAAKESTQKALSIGIPVIHELESWHSGVIGGLVASMPSPGV